MKFWFLILALLVATPTWAQIPDLIFSEYIEGSSYNKALEIYNGTDQNASLSEYVVELYINGSTTPVTIELGSGTLGTGEVFVLANPAAIGAILGQADLTTSSLSFNGDDALVLVHDGVAVDRFGQVGFDPGSAWSCAGGSTVNATLRRQLNVCEGDADPFAAFDPCSGWEFYPNDSTDDLGQHSDDCHSVDVPALSWDMVKANYR